MHRRLFLDTNIYARAHIEDEGPSSALVTLAVNGSLAVVASEHLVNEVSRFFRNEFGRDEAYRMRATILAFPELQVVDRLRWERSLALVAPFVRDRTDGPHFAAARAAGAEALVSYNRRSILAGMFDLVPLATPESVLPALSGSADWPSKDALRRAWEEWARRSPRAPQ